MEKLDQIFITYEYKGNMFKTSNILQNVKIYQEIFVSDILNTNFREHSKIERVNMGNEKETFVLKICHTVKGYWKIYLVIISSIIQ